MVPEQFSYMPFQNKTRHDRVRGDVLVFRIQNSKLRCDPFGNGMPTLPRFIEQKTDGEDY